MRHTALELGNGTNILTLLAAKADASSVYTKTQVDGLIAGVAEGSTAAKVVNTIAERDALDPKRGFVWVVDATGDSTVVTGGAMYLYNEATSSWIKTAEAESMDLIVKWDDIQGKPEDITRAGNTFNTAGNLVKLGVDGKYPGIDGSLITNLSSANLNGQIGIGLIPISTNIATDAASDAKVATPKAVKTYVDDNTHTHSNKSTLDKIGEADGKMTFDGEEVGGIDPNFLSKTVWRYPATVDAESGVVTITDGTLVTEIRIGDKIVTSQGVYQKVKDSITTSGDPATSSINISGFTNPSNANGTYVFQSDKKWKHESENYWVTTSSNHWVISSMEAPAAPSAGLCYAPMNEGEMPWDVTSWQRVSSYGTPVLEQKTADTVVDNTIDLFEYASLPIDPANIVQSVNGNKPDASGNVTLEIESIDLSNYSAETIKLTGTKKIQIAGGSVTSGILDITTGDDGRPALTTPGLWSADIAGYLTAIHGGMQMDIYADSNQADVRIYAGGSPSSSSGNGNILLYGSDIKFNGNALNSANGLVKAEAGKLPALDGSKLTNLPAGTVDLSAYTGGINLSSTDDSAVAIKFNSGNPTYNAELSMSSSGVTLSGYGDVSLEHTGGSYLRLTSGEATLSSNASLTLSAGSRLTISASEGVYLGAAGLNTAGGFAVVGEDGKLPTSIIPASTIDLSNYSNDTISLTASGVFHIRGNTLNIGTASTSEIQIGNNNSTTYLNASAEDTLYLRIGNTTAYLNAPGGLARVGLDGKLPSEIVPSNDTGYTKETIDQSKFATEDAARGTKYFEIDGLCDVLLADADGTLIGVEVQFMFATTKTRVHIPASLAAGSIASWALLTKKITVAS